MIEPMIEYAANGILTVATVWLYARGKVNRDRGLRPSRLVLRNQGRMLQGVCAGLADYFGISVFLVRFVFALAALFWPTIWVSYLLLGTTLSWHERDTEHWLRNRLQRWFSQRISNLA